RHFLGRPSAAAPPHIQKELLPAFPWEACDGSVSLTQATPTLTGSFVSLSNPGSVYVAYPALRCRVWPENLFGCPTPSRNLQEVCCAVEDHIEQNSQSLRHNNLPSSQTTQGFLQLAGWVFCLELSRCCYSTPSL